MTFSLNFTIHHWLTAVFALSLEKFGLLGMVELLGTMEGNCTFYVLIFTFIQMWLTSEDILISLSFIMFYITILKIFFHPLDVSIRRCFICDFPIGARHVSSRICHDSETVHIFPAIHKKLRYIWIYSTYFIFLNLENINSPFQLMLGRHNKMFQCYFFAGTFFMESTRYITKELHQRIKCPVGNSELYMFLRKATEQFWSISNKISGDS